MLPTTQQGSLIALILQQNYSTRFSMLNRIDLHQFKCFECLKLPLAPLSFLSGQNASGKSSILQSLALLNQTMIEHEWSKRLMLNGSIINLGTVGDVVDKVYGRKNFSIGLQYKEKYYKWVFSGERADMSMSIEQIIMNKKEICYPQILRYLLDPEPNPSVEKFTSIIRKLSYITAERIGPREIYDLEDRQIANNVGTSGKNAISVLYWGRDKEVPSGLALEQAPNNLIRQVEARMKDFFPNFSLDIKQIPRTNAVTFGIRTSEDTDYPRPIHVGFGVTQIFPIIVSALSASPGDILLIENPEVHLHPAGQSQMGLFLAHAAKSGVQIIIESHSDHVLNGIRRAVKNNILSHKDIVLHFFKPRSKNSTQVESPQIDQSGNIDSWPKGFFDQYEKDMNYFSGWSI